MLQITISSPDGWDEAREEFVTPISKKITLEHSLVSLAKWEAKWGEPFLAKSEKSTEKTIDYIRCMTITQNVDPDLYNYITNDNLQQINSYIDAPMTATWFSEDKSKPASHKKQITAELIYYWMIAFNIPFECQKWHLNRLLTLIKVCNIENQPPKKRSKKEIMARNSALNEARKKQLNTSG